MAALLAVGMLSFGLAETDTDPVAAGPASHTDCSWGFSVTWSVPGGEAGSIQKAVGTNRNFSPGRLGTDIYTGWLVP